MPNVCGLHHVRALAACHVQVRPTDSRRQRVPGRLRVTATACMQECAWFGTSSFQLCWLAGSC